MIWISSIRSWCLADLESVDKKKVKTAKLAQAGLQAKLDLPVLEKVFDALQEGTPARALDLSEDDLEVLEGVESHHAEACPLCAECRGR